jgi:hypothetical protein
VGLCEWLVASKCPVDRRSALGTPLHWALLGERSLLNAILDPASLKYFMSQIVDDPYCQRVVKLLVNNGACIDSTFLDPCGQRHSCYTLALSRRPFEVLGYFLEAKTILGQRFLREFRVAITENLDTSSNGIEEKVKSSSQDDESKKNY